MHIRNHITRLFQPSPKWIIKYLDPRVATILGSYKGVRCPRIIPHTL